MPLSSRIVCSGSLSSEWIAAVEPVLSKASFVLACHPVLSLQSVLYNSGVFREMKGICLYERINSKYVAVSI